MPDVLGADAIDQLFTDARTHYDWETEALDEGLLRRLYDLARMGPTAANGSPARLIFCTSVEARDKLASLSSDGNAPKIRMAPVTVIVGMDMEFHHQLPKLFPHTDAKSWFDGKDALIREAAFRNSSLQGAWLIMAARTLGLDTGPMSGFDKPAVDRAFWAGTKVETNFICSLGHGTGEKLFPRLPRLSFEEACRIA